MASGIFILMSGGPALLGWTTIVFFGACIPILILQFINTNARLIIDDEGVIDRTLGVGKIPWNEITGAYLKTIQTNAFICLNLRNNETYTDKLNPVKKAMLAMNEKLGFTPISLNLVGTNVEPEQVLEVVLKMIQTKTSK